jgi:hypothetical protein
MHLSRHRKAAFFAQRSQRPGVGERYTDKNKSEFLAELNAHPRLAF